VEALVIGWRELLVVVIAVLGVYVAELVLLLRWSGPRGTRAWMRTPPTSTESQVLNSMGLEIAELRQQVARLQAEVDKLRSVSLPATSPYNQAIQMARQGLSASEVASGCGISRGEAELIVALYRKLRI
jgi:hypothetical protein